MRFSYLRRFAIAGMLAAIVGAIVAIAPLQAQSPPNPDVRSLRMAIVMAVSVPQDSDVASDIAKVVASNLKRDAVFTLTAAPNTGKISGINVVPQFSDWRALNVEFLVIARVTRSEGDRLTAEFRLWDVTAEAYLAGQQFTTSADKSGLIGNVITDAIYERITGKPGNFQ